MRLARPACAQQPLQARPARRQAGTRDSTGPGGALTAAGGSESTAWSAADSVAGLLATVSIFASVLGLLYRPVRILPFAILLALIASRMSGRQQRLAGWAVAAGVACWTVGMTIAVLTESPLY